MPVRIESMLGTPWSGQVVRWSCSTTGLERERGKRERERERERETCKIREYAGDPVVGPGGEMELLHHGTGERERERETNL